MSGWYVTANDIKVWTASNKRRAEEKLPLLVKKLILASCTPTKIDFPSGDSIAIGGWDGILEVDKGNDFIPSGKSGWEFGTNEDVKGKADDDYSKRLTNPSPLDFGSSSFVFVTSRLWTKRDNWVRSKQNDNKWRDVKALNAESLQDWIEQCPAVHRWFSELIGKRCIDLWDIEQSWNVFSNFTSIPLNTEFFLHNREEEAKELKRLLHGDPSIYRIKSRSINEAYGFILSVIKEALGLSPRCLIVRTQSAWDMIANSDQNLILIPQGFQPIGLGAAVNKGHTVLIAVDEKSTENFSINLTHHSRLIRQTAIEKLGFSGEESSVIWNDTKGYIEPILRHPLIKPIDKLKPLWPQNYPNNVLFSIFFATEWVEDDSKDKEIMELLSGLSYEEFEKIVIELSNVDDPPIRKIGAVWQVISKMDLWLLIAPNIARTYLDSFSESLERVLGDLDPSYELPPEERIMASVKGLTPRYSQKLKHGLSDSMAILAVYGDEYSNQIGGDKPSEILNYLVKQLFKKNNNTKFWYSINNIIPLIAESTPDAFLDAVESASYGEKPPLLGLFQTENDSIFGNCNHSGLLWGIELVSWNKKYMAKASLCLARLSEIDPGGKWSNRPFNSLIDMYLGWINNTSATHDERIMVLESVLIPNHSKITWQLMTKLLPGNTKTTSGICKPRYREWSSSSDIKSTQKLYSDYIKALVNIMLKEMECNFAERIPDVLENFDSCTAEQQDSTIEQLLSINISEVNMDVRENILNELRESLANHREFSDAKWSWPESLLGKLEKVYNYYNHNDYIKSNVYLFNDYWPRMIEPIKRKEMDYKERGKLLLQKRVSTLDSLYVKHGIEGISELITVSKLPHLIGDISYQSSFSEDIQPFVLECLEKVDGRGDFSKGFISSLANKNYNKAISLIEDHWSTNKKAVFLLCLPITNETLLLVNKLDDKGRQLFWKNINHYSVENEEVTLANIIASNLLENERPLAAIHSVSHFLEDSSRLDSRLVASILTEIAIKPLGADKVSLQNVRHDILSAIEFIQDSDNLLESEIIQIEWFYLKLFKFEEIKPLYLMKRITTDPSFFSQLIIWIYKRNDGKEDNPDEALSYEIINQRAEIALELLDSIQILPGQKGNEVNVHLLTEWIEKVREILKDAGRKEIGDIYIGKYLSRCPVGQDNIWPHFSVRQIIERIKSKEIEKGIINGLLNSRGVTTRNPYDGGKQEAIQAKLYDDQAESIQLISPRTSEVLRSIARIYENDAKREDREVELR